MHSKVACIRWPAALLAWLVGATAIVLPAAIVPPAERYLPQETIFFATLRDFGVLRAQLSRSPLGQLWQDPAMQPFVTHLSSNLTQMIGSLLGDWQSAEELRSLVRGQVTIAAVQASSGSQLFQPPALFILIDTKERVSEAASFLKNLENRLTEKGLPPKRESVGPSTFLVLQTRANHKGELFFGLHSTALVFGTDQGTLRKIITAIEEKNEAVLANQSSFIATTRAVPNDAPLLIWCQVERLSQLMTAAVRSAAPQHEEALPVPQIGQNMIASLFGGLDEVVWAVQMNTNMVTCSFFANSPVSERKGLLSKLFTGSADCTPPEFVPEDVLAMSRLRISPVRILDGFISIMDSIMPGSGTALSTQLDAVTRQLVPGFRGVRQDLIGLLGDDIISVEIPQLEAAQQSNSLKIGQTVVFLACDNAATFLQNARRIATAMGLGWNELQVASHTIYKLEQGQPQFSVKDNQRQGRGGLLLAQYGNYIVLTDREWALERLFQFSRTTPLARSKDFRYAIEQIGGGNGWFASYTNVRAEARIIWPMLKRGVLLDQIVNLMPTLSAIVPVQQADQLADILREAVAAFKLLPEFDLVQRYFKISVARGWTDEGGIHVQALMLTD